jgi:GntR family transcriptional repressor for pyruvate dehydrogenase complex
LAGIRRLIETSALKPGSKLPPERTLAVKLKAGRPAVREAIKALTMLDVLDSRRGDGTYVKSLAGLRREGTGLVEAGFDLIELLELRKMIEPRASALAALRATDKQLQEIERELLRQEAKPNDHDVLERHDYLFHAAILRAAGNGMLSGVVQFLDGSLRKSRQLTSHTTPEVPKIVGEHRVIFNAIKRGQADLAERAMLEHLQTVGLDLISERKR